MPGRPAGCSTTSCDANLKLEDFHDLKNFLRIARPDWLCPRRLGHSSDIHRVLEKLKAIGITDTWEFVKRVCSNRINDDLGAAGYARFSRETIESVRKQGVFIRSLEHLRDPFQRQTGLFAPVPQMLVGRSLRPCPGTEQLTSKRRHCRPSSSRLDASIDDMVDAGAALIVGEPFCSLDDISPTIGIDYGRATLRGVKPKSHSTQKSLMRSTCTSLPDLAFARQGGIDLAAASDSKRPRTDSDTRARNGASSSSSGKACARAESLSISPPLDFAGLQKMSKNLDDFETHAGKWQRAGDQMLSVPQAARWIRLNESSSLRHGEDMLEEQAALDDKARLRKVMMGEGVESPMRRHVTTKIQTRLREERSRGRDAQGVLDVQQRCINIRKNLTSMMNARRELNTMRSRVQGLVESEEDKHGLKDGFSLEIFQRAKRSMAADDDVVSKHVAPTVAKSPRPLPL